ncbi:MAG: cytochrome c biogenesis protein CcsA [Planctomycetaceae bacterium]
MANVQVFCFLASYAVAFGLELSRFIGRSRVSRYAMVGFAIAGIVAHTWYLLNRFRHTDLPPLLASTHDWMLVLAWVLVLLYLLLTILQKDLAVGLFALPLVLLLVASTYFLSQAPNEAINTSTARRHWGMLHASLLVFGMASCVAGLVSGVMYLVQHRRLRTRHAEFSGIHMPSLARLARVNRWSMFLTFFLLTLGFASGLALALRPPGGETTVGFREPTVIGSGVIWLILVALFAHFLRHDAPTGRQVAWLTILGCGFVLFTVLGLQLLTGQIHGSRAPAEPELHLSAIADCGSRIVDLSSTSARTIFDRQYSFADRAAARIEEGRP